MSSVVSTAKAPLRKGGWSAGPPTAIVSYSELAVTAATPTASARRWRTSANIAAGLPRVAPKATTAWVTAPPWQEQVRGTTAVRRLGDPGPRRARSPRLGRRQVRPPPHGFQVRRRNRSDPRLHRAPPILETLDTPA